jgi:hypothetical protein
MRVVRSLLCFALLAGVPAVPVIAQCQPAAAKPPLETRFFHLQNSNSPNEANEILTGMRQMLPPTTKLYLAAIQNAFIVQGEPADLAMAERIVAELDKPMKAYRLNYTISTYDAGKRLGEQHYALVAAVNSNTVLKSGNRIPVAMVSDKADTAQQNTHVSYVDIGLTIDATLYLSGTIARLNSRIEQSSVAEDKPATPGQNPILHQNLISGSSVLAVGKPVKLGALDVPGSTRHMEIDVVMEPIP